jgi:L-amino acid N-acyltransferase YncA
MNMPAESNIAAAGPADAPAICAIYNHYIAHTAVTFEETPVTPDDIAQRIAEVGAHLPWLALREGDHLLGYAYATPWRARSAYRYSVETTVYLDHQFTGRGHGRRLYAALLEDLRSRGLRTAIGGITQPNAPSVALHERLGFTRVAMFREVGFKFGRWLDVGYWQRPL